jgi:hypothetical protein
MPDAPRFHILGQTLGDSPSIESNTTRSDKPEYRSYQAFIATIHAESKGLQQIEYRPDKDTVNDTVSQQVVALLKRIDAGQE